MNQTTDNKNNTEKISNKNTNNNPSKKMKLKELKVIKIKLIPSSKKTKKYFKEKRYPNN